MTKTACKFYIRKDLDRHHAAEPYYAYMHMYMHMHSRVLRNIELYDMPHAKAQTWAVLLVVEQAGMKDQVPVLQPAILDIPLQLNSQQLYSIKQTNNFLVLPCSVQVMIKV